MNASLISALVILSMAHYASVAFTNHVILWKPAVTLVTIDVPAAVKATVAILYPGA